MLVVRAGVDGSAVADKGSSVGHDWWRCNCYAFKLTQEIACVRWLVVSAHLPHDALSVLHVVEQCIIAPFSRNCSCVDSEHHVCLIAQNYFLAPVAEKVCLKTGCTFGSVVCQRTVESCDGIPASVFYNARFITYIVGTA